MEQRRVGRQELKETFADRFGDASGAQLAVSPGRINLIGEHTDYNGGPVMPIAIDMCVEMVFRRRDDGMVVMHSVTTDDSGEFSIDDMESMKGSGWMCYPAGVLFMLREAGVEICGMEAVVGGNLPLGIGLSSSAALEVAVAVAQVHLASTKISRLDIARVCQKAEHEFAGVNCGIMDQFAAVIGSRKGPVYLECDSMKFKELPLPDDVAVVLCDTGVKHSLGASEYNKRRAECEEAFKFLSSKVRGLKSLSRMPLGEFRLLKKHLRPVVAMRVEHVITETKRTQEAARALAVSNPLQVGVLMNASHVSLRDNYEVTCPELDTLAEAAWDAMGVYGSRMTGGGFGGCTVTLVDREKVGELERSLRKAYMEAYKREPDMYVCNPHRGAYVKEYPDVNQEDVNDN